MNSALNLPDSLSDQNHLSDIDLKKTIREDSTYHVVAPEGVSFDLRYKIAERVRDSLSDLPLALSDGEQLLIPLGEAESDVWNMDISLDSPERFSDSVSESVEIFGLTAVLDRRDRIIKIVRMSDDPQDEIGRRA